MSKLKEGDLAPAIEAVDQNGERITHEQYRGKKVVLYFYPKDNTPGCTAESCDLRDNYSQFLEGGFEIIGVSADSEKSHRSFISKYELPFRLISDEDKKVLQDYEAWGEKKMYGKSYMGILRKTCIINEAGYVEKIIEKVITKEHSKQIFTELSH
ncbi:MAG: thioredoxin-dependent thiol peroxidase [Bacteroidales bacterium]|nr:thioredoxin-dependent thiol peroxidase [Bacteroidales bacterium]